MDTGDTMQKILNCLKEINKITGLNYQFFMDELGECAIKVGIRPIDKRWVKIYSLGHISCVEINIQDRLDAMKELKNA